MTHLFVTGRRVTQRQHKRKVVHLLPEWESLEGDVYDLL